MGTDINKLLLVLIGSETSLATDRVSDTDADAEGKVKDQVAVAEKRLNELRKKYQNAGQQIVGHASQGVRNRQNSGWSQTTGASDETPGRAFSFDNYTLIL